MTNGSHSGPTENRHTVRSTKTWGDYMPQKYLKATDFPREGVDLRIVGFSEENTGTAQVRDIKAAIWFDGLAAPLVINVTNGEELQRQFGDDPSDCVGRTVNVYQTTTQYMGKSVPAARIGPPRSMSEQSGQ